MQYAHLGSSGLQVSRLCLGTGAFGVAPLEADAAALVHRALDLGINFIDTANSYGNFRRMDRPGAPTYTDRPSAEEIVGRALKGRRDEAVLATKVREPVGAGVNDAGLSRRHIMQQVERSLTRLQTDYLDLYHMHGFDSQTPLDETFQAFDDLVHQGKVRYLGFSNYSGWRMAAAMGRCEALGLQTPVVHQMGYNLVTRNAEGDTIAAALHYGVGVTCYSSLAMGLLSGADVTSRPIYGMQRFVEDKSRPIPWAPDQMDAAKKMEGMAQEWGLAPAHVALAWLVSRPAVASAIIGPESVDELETAAPAGDLVLDAEQRAALDALLPPPASFEGAYDAAMTAVTLQAQGRQP
jgi:aryl-alcohol dehydrogenase-like predicted oxidoreductase